MLAQPATGVSEPAAVHGQLVTGKPLAPAALTRHLDCPDDAEGYWLRADPVDLTPDLASVWLHAGARMSPRSPAATELIELFSHEGMTLEFPVPERGYVRLEREPECRFSPPWKLAGKSMDLVFPAGAEAMFWQRLLNETQVVLHQHRHSATDPDQYLPGTLWFWGGGSLPERDSVHARFNCVAADDPILEALARWLGLELQAPDEGTDPAPGMLIEWPLDRALSAGRNLERLDAFLKRAWRRLRLDRGLASVELASLEWVWRFSTLDAWRPWR